MNLSDYILAVNYFVLGYFLVINGIYVALYVVSFAEIADYVRREVFSGFSELFTSNYAPPVSVVVPAYNEEATIAESVRSFLTLHYPLHEVVVVNDGSTDATLEVLVREFDLYESDQPVRLQLDVCCVVCKVKRGPSESSPSKGASDGPIRAYPTVGPPG
ncbi:MAG: glycosyltransferase, partial [Actinomycetota bacterium]|nr:glycosyltransferase [Actinomycetota bacterium]